AGRRALESLRDCLPIMRAHAAMDEENLRPIFGTRTKTRVKLARTLDLVHEDEHEASGRRFAKNRREQLGTLDRPAGVGCPCYLFGRLPAPGARWLDSGVNGHGRVQTQLQALRRSPARNELRML